jgi:hypothetical protein
LETVQKMIRFVPVGFSELPAVFSEAKNRHDRKDDVVFDVRFECGLRLWVLVPKASGSLLCVPEFHRVWWRNAYSWAKQFRSIEAVVSELGGLGRRSRHPFLASAPSRFTGWEPVWSGYRVDLDDYVEFVLPDCPGALAEAGRFLQEWADSVGFVERQVDPLDAEAQQQATLALMSMPTGEAADLESCLADRVEGILLDMIQRPHGPYACNVEFPNLLQELLPATLSEESKVRWRRICALRVEWLTRVAGPEHYSHVQGLASTDQWERQFVFEASAPRCRGNSLVGGELMRRLLEIGTMLEKRHPVLAKEALSPLQS